MSMLLYLGVLVVAILILLTVSIDSLAGVAAGMALILIVIFGNPSVPGLLIMSSFAGICLIFVCVMVRKPSGQSVRFGMSTISLFAVFALTLVVSFARGFSGLLFHAVVLLGLVAAGSIFALFGERDKLIFARILTAVSIVQVFLSFGEVTGSLTPLWGLRNSFERTNPFLGDQLFRAQGTMGHPIALAVLLAATLIVVLQRRVKLSQAAHYMTVSLLSIGIILTGTRSVVISLLVAGAFWLASDNRRGMAGRVMSSFFALSVALVVFYSEIDKILNELIDSGSYTNRLFVIMSIPSLIEQGFVNVMFGAGLSGESKLFQSGVLSSGTLNVVDNQFISTYINAGLIGAGLLLVTFIFCFRARSLNVRVMSVFLFSMLMVFDMFSWYSCVFLLIWCTCSVLKKDSMGQDEKLRVSSQGRAGALP